MDEQRTIDEINRLIVKMAHEIGTPDLINEVVDRVSAVVLDEAYIVAAVLALVSRGTALGMLRDIEAEYAPPEIPEIPEGNVEPDEDKLRDMLKDIRTEYPDRRWC